MFKDSSCRHNFEAQPPTTTAPQEATVAATTTTTTLTTHAEQQSDVVAITAALRTTKESTNIEPPSSSRTTAATTTRTITSKATINPSKDKSKSYEFECVELELTNSSISSDTNSNSSNNHNNSCTSSNSSCSGTNSSGSESESEYDSEKQPEQQQQQKEEEFNNQEATRGALQTAASTSKSVSLAQTHSVGGSHSHSHSHKIKKIINTKSANTLTKESKVQTTTTTTLLKSNKKKKNNKNKLKHKKYRDVYLLRKIGYIATRVRLLADIYDNFKLVNPYTKHKQRQLLQEILLKHSLPKSLIEEAENVLNVNNDDEETTTVTTITTITTADTVRRKSSTTSASASASACASVGSVSVCSEVAAVSCSSESCTSSLGDSTKAHLALLEEFLIKLYEDRDQTVTIISKQPYKKQLEQFNKTATTATTTTQHQLLIMSDRTSHCSSSNSNSSSIEGLREEATNILNANTSSQQQQQQQQPQKQIYLLQADNQRRRRASDCAAPTSQLLSVTFKQQQQQQQFNNNNRLPLHRGSCGATSEHWLAANTIANRSTIILSKSCNNVDTGLAGDLAKHKDLAAVASVVGIGVGVGMGVGVGIGVGSPETVDSQTTSTTPNGKKQHQTGRGSLSNNGNEHDNGNDYSIVQLNNTIIQCHFNDDDFRALVKDLKRKVEYAERMNWLRLSKRPMGPANRKSSLPKHQEVKKRFLEICDTTFSNEVKAALRLPAFDSYEWSDADVIHLMQTMFIELGFIEKFNIPKDTLREWLYEVYKHYNEVPFHNFRHCFCVAQMMYAITRQANLLQRLGHLECLILLVSCICHDLDHPGYNNIYQINARTELALRYNDISPLENHHCSIAFRLLEHPECNIFKNFSRETFNQIREGIIRCILATDMARHNEILSQFKEITPIFDFSNRAHINLLCMILIKVADISNEARPMDVAEPWLDRLLQEFFAQSAAEKSEGLPVTPFMDPDKISKPGSQVRFIGLVLLPLFEALGDLVPELIELIIIPVRIALDYYKRLNDAQIKSRKSVADTSSQAASENNSGASESTTAGSGLSGSLGTALNAQAPPSGSAISVSAPSGNSISPQLPRSQSAISCKSRRSLPAQKSASHTSVDEPQCMAAELHDLPEGSESGDSETATEVDVAEKTSKFKVDTEGCSSNRSKSSTSRKPSREKRPSMIGEICSGGGQRMRNSYGNIHGHHTNRCHFGSNRAVSLDQYSTNNRRLSDGLQQVISDSNVFYNRQNRGSLETNHSATRLVEDLNMNAHEPHIPQTLNYKQIQSALQSTNSSVLMNNQQLSTAASNGNLSPQQKQPQQLQQHCCAASALAAASAANNTSNGMTNNMSSSEIHTTTNRSSWKARLRQFSDYLGFSFDKSSKRFGSTRSTPASLRNNNTTTVGMVGTTAGKHSGVCCTISNNLHSPAVLRKNTLPTHQELLQAAAVRHRAYSLDVPSNRCFTRHSSSSGGGGDSSRKSSRHEAVTNGDGDTNSNNTLQSSGAGSEMPTCLPPPIRIGSVNASDTILINTSSLQRVLTPSQLGEAELSMSIDLGMASASSSEAPKI